MSRNSGRIKEICHDSMVNVMLEFVRAAVLDRTPIMSSEVMVDWDRLMDLSAEQGLLALVWDGICKLPAELQPPRQQRINWGLSAQEIWCDYDRQKSVLKELVAVCKQNDMRLLLLKGIGLSEMYPTPNSRPSGDIDVFLFGDYEKGNRILANNTFDFSNKHSVFEYKGVTVENHQNFFYHGTRLQIDVDNYLLSVLSDCSMTKDGYYVLPKEAGLVHLLLHTMVHMNNPHEHITMKNLVDVACYLFFNRNELSPELCGCTMRKLNLEKAFDLYLQVSEWVLSIDLSLYRDELSCKSEDLDNVISLLSDDFLRGPLFNNYSFVKQLTQRISYFKKTKWRYTYLPNWGVHNRGFFIRQLSYFVKSVFKIPFNVPLIQFKKRG